jgi:hypothetical protein
VDAIDVVMDRGAPRGYDNFASILDTSLPPTHTKCFVPAAAALRTHLVFRSMPSLGNWRSASLQDSIRCGIAIARDTSTFLVDHLFRNNGTVDTMYFRNIDTVLHKFAYLTFREP